MGKNNNSKKVNPLVVVGAIAGAVAVAAKKQRIIRVRNPLLHIVKILIKMMKDKFIL